MKEELTIKHLTMRQKILKALEPHSEIKSRVIGGFIAILMGTQLIKETKNKQCKKCGASHFNYLDAIECCNGEEK